MASTGVRSLEVYSMDAVEAVRTTEHFEMDSDLASEPSLDHTDWMEDSNPLETPPVVVLDPPVPALVHSDRRCKGKVMVMIITMVCCAVVVREPPQSFQTVLPCWITDNVQVDVLPTVDAHPPGATDPKTHIETSAQYNYTMGCCRPFADSWILDVCIGGPNASGYTKAYVERVVSGYMELYLERLFCHLSAGLCVNLDSRSLAGVVAATAQDDPCVEFDEGETSPLAILADDSMPRLPSFGLALVRNLFTGLESDGMQTGHQIFEELLPTIVNMRGHNDSAFSKHIRIVSEGRSITRLSQIISCPGSPLIRLDLLGAVALPEKALLYVGQARWMLVKYPLKLPLATVRHLIDQPPRKQQRSTVDVGAILNAEACIVTSAHYKYSIDCCRSFAESWILDAWIGCPNDTGDMDSSFDRVFCVYIEAYLQRLFSNLFASWCARLDSRSLAGVVAAGAQDDPFVEFEEGKPSLLAILADDSMFRLPSFNPALLRNLFTGLECDGIRKAHQMFKELLPTIVGMRGGNDSVFSKDILIVSEEESAMRLP